MRFLFAMTKVFDTTVVEVKDEGSIVGTLFNQVSGFMTIRLITTGFLWCIPFSADVWLNFCEFLGNPEYNRCLYSESNTCYISEKGNRNSFLS